MSAITQVFDKKPYIIIPITDKTNLDQCCIIDKTPFYFQPTNTNMDTEIAVLIPEAQTYKLCIKRNFYSKFVNKSYNIFQLLESYFAETIIISSNTDISFNYSMTAKFPISKYKLVLQGLMNWYSIANWWWLIFPTEKVGIITLNEKEIYALREYPNITKNDMYECVLDELCKRINILIKYICMGSDNNSIDTSKLWIQCSDPNVCIRPGSVLQAYANANTNTAEYGISGKDVINYLIEHTGFKKQCLSGYQGYIDFLLFNIPHPNFELCISVFIRTNKLVAISQTDLDTGYSARLSNLINSNGEQIINMINLKWAQLISIDGGKLEYEDVVLTIELIPLSTNQPISSAANLLENEVINDIKIWNIQMGYGAWTNTSSKLFTWAELELLTGIPPVIKLLAKPVLSSKSLLRL